MKTCRHGHEMTLENRMPAGRYVRCRQCVNAVQRARDRGMRLAEYMTLPEAERAPRLRGRDRVPRLRRSHCKWGHPLTPEHPRCPVCQHSKYLARILGLTVADYMALGDEGQAVLLAARRAGRLDWSVPQHCTNCGREMKPRGRVSSPADPRPPHAAKGLCSSCYEPNRSTRK